MIYICKSQYNYKCLYSFKKKKVIVLRPGVSVASYTKFAAIFMELCGGASQENIKHFHSFSPLFWCQGGPTRI